MGKGTLEGTWSVTGYRAEGEKSVEVDSQGLLPWAVGWVLMPLLRKRIRGRSWLEEGKIRISL